MVAEAEGEAFVDGNRYDTDWTQKYGSWYEDFTIIPWPEPAVGKRPCHFRILADIAPRRVTLSAAPSVDPSNGWMARDGRLEYECGRGGDRPCAHLDDDGFVEIHPILEAILDCPYLIIQGLWWVHPRDRIEEPIRAWMMAAYLFNFSEE